MLNAHGIDSRIFLESSIFVMFYFFVVHRVWAPEKWLWGADWTLEIIVTAITLYEELFKSELPLKKLDFIVALPYHGIV